MTSMVPSSSRLITTSWEAEMASGAPSGLCDAWNGVLAMVWPSHFMSTAGGSPPPLSQVSKLIDRPAESPSSIGWLRSGVGGGKFSGTGLKRKLVERKRTRHDQ